MQHGYIHRGACVYVCVCGCLIVLRMLVLVISFVCMCEGSLLTHYLSPLSGGRRDGADEKLSKPIERNDLVLLCIYVQPTSNIYE